MERYASRGDWHKAIAIAEKKASYAFVYSNHALGLSISLFIFIAELF